MSSQRLYEMEEFMNEDVIQTCATRSTCAMTCLRESSSEDNAMSVAVC